MSDRSPSIDVVSTPSPTHNADLIASGSDAAVRPQDDLFRHLSGRWLAEFEIPADKARYGEFHRLAEQAEKDVRAIIEEAAASPGGGVDPAETAKIAALYTAFMDTEAIEAAGVAPLRADLDPVEAAPDRTELARVMGELASTGVGGAIAVYVEPDADAPGVYALYLTQSGLGLPDEAYYREDAHAAVRDAYLAHLGRQLALTLGLSREDAEARARTVLDLETRLAGGHWDRVRDRDAVETHNPVTAQELAELLPGFDLAAWADGLGLTGGVDALPVRLIVREPSFLETFAAAWTQEPLETWQAWLAWRVVRSRAPFLTAAIVEENFDFYGRTLTGAPELRERWKRGVAFVEGALGDAVARIYVDRHFPPEHKARMDELVEHLVEAYRVSIADLPWMTPATRQKALAKLDAFTPKIGYPVKWRDYSALDLSGVSGDLVAMDRAATRHEWQFELDKLGKPVDRDEWYMTPQTVNAYYHPLLNEIAFPAAILQPPFFNAAGSDAGNFGGIGAVIGHEIGHGFDDQGSQFDGTGALVNWWTDEDRAEFEKRTAALIAQYDAFVPTQLRTATSPGEATDDEAAEAEDRTDHVNGALTIGENIGDLGGLGIAIKAYRLALAAAAPDGVVDPEVERAGLRELFEGWGLVWREKGRDAEVRRLLAIDPHSPAEFRCNGVPRNLPEFYEVYDVQPGDGMWLDPSERVRIW